MPTFLGLQKCFEYGLARQKIYNLDDDNSAVLNAHELLHADTS